jgi:hypothetical protein
MNYVILNQVKESHGEYNDATGDYENIDQHIPTVVQLSTISRAYPRHGGRPGTRLTFTDGGGFAVSEAFDQILAVLGTVQGSAVLAVSVSPPASLEALTH